MCGEIVSNSSGSAKLVLTAPKAAIRRGVLSDVFHQSPVLNAPVNMRGFSIFQLQGSLPYLFPKPGLRNSPRVWKIRCKIVRFIIPRFEPALSKVWTFNFGDSSWGWWGAWTMIWHGSVSKKHRSTTGTSQFYLEHLRWLGYLLHRVTGKFRLKRVTQTTPTQGLSFENQKQRTSAVRPLHTCHQPGRAWHPHPVRPHFPSAIRTRTQ